MVHTKITPRGGGNALAVWVLQALVQAQYRVILLTQQPVDCAALNRVFGTTLKDTDFTLRLAPSWRTTVLHKTPTPSAYLAKSLLHRQARRIKRKENIDIAIGTENEADLGAQPVIQYIHFPAALRQRPENDLRWYHRIPGSVNLYYRLTDMLAGVSQKRLRSNFTLTNSAYIGELVRQTHGICTTTLYPPVPGRFPQMPWQQRQTGVVCLGRIARDKNTMAAIDVVERVRAVGIELKLHIIGVVDDSHYMRRIRVKAGQHSGWLRIHNDLSRRALLDLLVQNRYGLHVMEGEHFGIAVAELQRAGCITFAHNSGGPREILGYDSRVLFDNIEDAAHKLAQVINDAELQQSLCTAVAKRRHRFTEQRFIDEFLKHVGELLAAH